MSDTKPPMIRALELAERAARIGEVPVGAVIVDPETQEIVAEGHNQPIADHDPTAHAEIRALRAAAEKLQNYRLPGLHLYVTLEPCAMCAQAIAHARLSRLYFGAEDPKGGGTLYGARIFDQPTTHHRPTIYGGIQAEKAEKLLKRFFAARRKRKMYTDSSMISGEET